MTSCARISARWVGHLADLFHFLVMFSLFMFLLERLSARTVANAAVATLAAVLVLVVVNADAGLATGDEVGSELDIHDIQPAVPARRR